MPQALVLLVENEIYLLMLKLLEFLRLLKIVCWISQNCTLEEEALCELIVFYSQIAM